MGGTAARDPVAMTIGGPQSITACFQGMGPMNFAVARTTFTPRLSKGLRVMGGQSSRSPVAHGP